MATLARLRNNALGLLLPALLLAVLMATIGFQIGVLRPPAATAIVAPDTVVVPPHAYAYRDSGNFQQQGLQVDAPRLEIARTSPLEITTHQVSVVDYAQCVQAGACATAAPRRKPAPRRHPSPVTNAIGDASAPPVSNRRPHRSWRRSMLMPVSRQRS